MDPALFGAFLAAAVALIVTPGPDWAYCIRAGVGARRAMPAVAGLATGYAVHSTVVTLGLATLVLAVPAVLTGLTWIGAAYLLGLGIRTLRHSSRADLGAGAGRSALGGSGEYVGGILTSLSNPKALLMFVAFLPQFVSPQAAYPLWVQLAILGCVYTLVTVGVYSGVALGARATLGGRPSAARAITRVSGVLMVVLAVTLVADALVR